MVTASKTAYMMDPIAQASRQLVCVGHVQVLACLQMHGNSRPRLATAGLVEFRALLGNRKTVMRCTWHSTLLHASSMHLPEGLGLGDTYTWLDVVAAADILIQSLVFTSDPSNVAGVQSSAQLSGCA